MERDAQRWPDDRLRPLAPRGGARGRKAAAGLARLGATPTLVLSSPLRRARQTAQILEQEARWPPARICEDLVPEARPQALLLSLSARANLCIAVIGHEPHLGALLAECLGVQVGKGLALRKMGAALVRFRGRARAGEGQLVWLASPRLLRAARRR